MKLLHLTLKRRWFDMILRGEKLEEYREIKPYWEKRLEGRAFDAIHFRNGYASDAPQFVVEAVSLGIGRGRPEWGAPKDRDVFILKLGRILD